MFSLIFYKRLSYVLQEVFRELDTGQISCRVLERADAGALYHLINSQPLADLEYFRPHGFDIVSIEDKLENKSFLMMGMFSDNRLLGYFFLRFFLNKRCFVGRLIDIHYRGKGLGTIMNKIMYETAWRMDFRCFSTISIRNSNVMRAHSKNSQMIVLKKLQDDYLLVEFVR